MTRRSLGRVHWLQGTFQVLAVLALALRSLIPTGFMIAPVDGGAALVLCPAGLHQHGHGLHSAHDRHYDHEHHGAGGVDHTAVGEHATGLAHGADQCPFALAGGPGLTGALPELAQPFYIVLQPRGEVATATIPRASPLRHCAPRGPPALV